MLFCSLIFCHACMHLTHLYTLSQLAGFFAVEDSVLRSGNELLSRSEVEQVCTPSDFCVWMLS
jgi:hypothetical protein